MKLSKDVNRSIRNRLWQYFQPLQDHLGLENASDIDTITDYLNKKCKLGITNEYQKELLKHTVVKKIFDTIMNKKSNLFIPGLDCEVINQKNNGVKTRVGYYYIVKTKEEIRHIKEIRNRGIQARQKGSSIHDLNNKNALEKLSYDSSIDRKMLTNGKK